jgi:hypothetical protein
MAASERSWPTRDPSGRPARRRQLRIESAGRFGAPAPLHEACNLQNSYMAIEGNGHNIPGPHPSARYRDPLAVDADMAAGHKCRGRAARAHYPCMPEPFIDTLAVQSFSGSAPLLCIRLELRLQRGKLGERRVGISKLLAPLLSRARGERTAFALLPVRTLRSRLTIGSVLTVRPRRAGLAGLR